MRLPQPETKPLTEKLLREKLLRIVEQFFSIRYCYGDMKVKKVCLFNPEDWEYDFTFYFPRKDLVPIEEFMDSEERPLCLVVHQLKFLVMAVGVKYLTGDNSLPQGYTGPVEFALRIDLRPMDVSIGELLNAMVELEEY